jgi:hypothetical protein
MRRFAVALTPVLVTLSIGCADDPDEGNAFQTQGNQTTVPSDDDSDTGVPQDMPAGDEGDGDGDGDGDPTTGDGDGDGEPPPPPPPACGNGIVDPGEQCDGGNLNGFSCVDLGYSGGTLGCDPVTCTYDASSCSTGGGGGGTTG